MTGAAVRPLAGVDVDGVDAALRGLGATVMAGRHPVLAVGSNAAPSQLWQKFADRGPDFAIPAFAVLVGGLAVGHSAHVSPAGYIPYTPYADHGRTLRAVLLWLDDAQLDRMDRTERNYDRVRLSSADHRLTLETGEVVAGYFLYRSVHGVIAGLPATSQRDAFARLAALPGFADVVPEGVDALPDLAGDPRRREAVTRVLAGQAIGSGLKVGGVL